jgi:DNA uptake protein ComE-like DNA-binding protein
MSEQPYQPQQPPPPPQPPQPPQPPVFNVQVPVNVHHHHHGGPPTGAPVPVTRDTSGIHLVHLILTVLSCGLWLPVWVVHAIVMASQKPPVVAAPGMPGMPPLSPEQANQIAVEQANARARRRQEARAMAAQNPMMARELLVGRPDVPAERRPYDDGGLIDVNVVPAQELTRFGITPETAQRIVALREQTGGFTSAEELAMMADLPPRLVPELIEYGLYLR